MRKTPLPLLRNLPPGQPVQRCRWCRDLVMQSEACIDPLQSEACPPRAVVEKPFEPTQHYRVSINA